MKGGVRFENLTAINGQNIRMRNQINMLHPQAAQRAFALTIEGFSASAAAKTAAQGTAYSKSEVYKQLLLLQQTAE